jgi:hypothetical protein
MFVNTPIVEKINIWTRFIIKRKVLSDYTNPVY